MIKKWLHITLLTGLPMFCLPQNKPQFNSANTQEINNLKQQLIHAKSDSDRMMATERIGFLYEHLDSDSSLHYINKALNIARQKSYTLAEARTLATLSGLMEHQGKYAEAFELLFASLKIAEQSNSAYDIARANRRISGIYYELQNYPKAITYLLKALPVDAANHYDDKVALDRYALADAYEKINKLDSATFHINFAIQQKHLLKHFMQYVYEIDGHIKQKIGRYEQAMLCYREGIEEAKLSNDLIGASQICADFSSLHKKINANDSAVYYALVGFNYAKEVSFKKGIMLNANLLAELYDSTQPALALKYLKIAAAAKDSLFGVSSTQAIENLVAREEAKQKELDAAKLIYKNSLRLYSLLTGLAVSLVIAFILYRNNQQKQKANMILQQQKQKVESTLMELKSTQAQLIQSEKMASLGELTAGIAHEIQNPLNFVNNFSETNTELVDELQTELKAGNYEDAFALSADLKENEQKIAHHGKRAEAIVKSMLEHSRTSKGERQPTDINVLVDEYLRLSYHGFRAKDKNFNANVETNFDKNIGKIDVIPQDVGRVLLNLFNNAFWTVNEKKKQADDSYEPTVTVSIKKENDKVEIMVADNGSGIPQHVLDKVFQPFFTTKPTGEGTGLGLSLSYDIVKAHGGDLKVESTEGVGAVFRIQLPA